MQKYGGISRYFYNIAKHLCKNDNVKIKAHHYKNTYIKKLPENIVDGKYWHEFPKKTEWIFKNYCDFMFALHDKSKYDIIHNTYFYNKRTEGKNAKNIITVYDMIHEIFPDQMNTKDPTSKIKKIAIEQSDHIISISYSTKHDLIKLYDVNPNKISVIHLGFELETDRDLIPFETHKPFLLYVGERYTYKNFDKMLTAFSSSKPINNDFRIIAFGGKPFNLFEEEKIKNLGLSLEQVIQISGDDKLLSSLYKSATAFILPSLYEGFGIPPLEAMAFSCPVICSNTSSIPEVVGKAGQYFNPNSTNEMKNAMEKVLLDANLQTDLASEGKKQLKKFNWSTCANMTRNIYEKVLSA